MNRIKQIEIASFTGLSPQMVCDIKKGRRFLSRKKAIEISEKTSVPVEILAFKTGDELYQALVSAYHQDKIAA